MKFDVKHTGKTGNARSGVLTTEHGTIETPIFMPVGTQATVKGVHQDELRDKVKAQIILSNTFHLYLRPGIEIVEEFGGLHKFMNWEYPILTDSGGYQVYSLAAMRKITEEGVSFRSHIDGSKHFFSPEYAIDVQRSLGADIIMAFDECTPYPCEYNYAKRSMHLTHRWLERCKNRMKETESKYGYENTLAGIVQGSSYEDLRAESAKVVNDTGLPINAIGGLSVGEPHEIMYAMTEIVTRHLDKDRPRYLMGVGTPENLLESIDRGIDMFDCVLPTRNARHGLLYTSNGIVNIKNAKWKKSKELIDENATVDTSRQHSRAYLHHLFRTGELLGAQLASIQNLSFYLHLVKEARKHIISGTFGPWKKEMVSRINQRL